MFCSSLGKCRSSVKSLPNAETEKYNYFLNTYDYLSGSLDDFIEKFKRDIIVLLDNNLLKSFKVFFLKKFISTYIPCSKFENGLLVKQSVNCKFTLANINSQSEKIFIKVVDNRIKSLIIYDIINSIIFDKFNKEFEADHGDIYETCLIKYKSSFISYYDNRGTNDYWNYNDLIYFVTNKNSKYNYKNLLKPTHIYKYLCHIFITDAVKGKAESIGQILNNYNERTKSKCFAVFASMYQVYLFLEWVGILRGYVHNDLHLGNILYDDINNRVIIIDYGQNVFCYYYDNNDDNINIEVNNIIKDLNLSDKFSLSRTLTYKEIIKSPYFSNNIPNFKIISRSNLNAPYYMGVIFDLMTLSLNLYKRLISMRVDDIKIIFENILVFDNNIIRINDIDFIYGDINYTTEINKYILCRTNIEDLEGSENQILKDVYLSILDGLFYFRLLLLKLNRFTLDLNANNGILYKGGLQIIYLKNSTLNLYLNFLYNEIYIPNISKFNRSLLLRLLPHLSVGGNSAKKMLKSIKKENNNFTVNNMQNYIKNIKKVFNYVTESNISIEDEDNSYIKLYEYIDDNKLSVLYKDELK